MTRRELTRAERGFLLLTSRLGDPDRQPLTVPQLRELGKRCSRRSGQDLSREMDCSDLIAMGYGRDFAQHILELLDGEALLDWYLSQAAKQDCVPLTRASKEYPLIVRKRLGQDAPGVLWARGDLGLLQTPAVSLVGSRELREENRCFAREAGRQAALQGLTLVSGNARGADKAGQNACLRAGGRVISVVADSLKDHIPGENMLYLSENTFEEDFSAQRALSRNRIIHTLGRIVFVAQSDLHKGGTWDGTLRNLRHGWSPVICFRDGSTAAAELEQTGAYLAQIQDLEDFCVLQKSAGNLFDME